MRLRKLAAESFGAKSVNDRMCDEDCGRVVEEPYNTTCNECLKVVGSAESFEACGCAGGNCQCAESLGKCFSCGKNAVSESLGHCLDCGQQYNAESGSATYEANGETEMVDFTESVDDTVMPEGDGNVIGQSTATTDFTPLGARAEGFVNEGFATDDFYPEGDGRVFGDITADADYTPLGSNADDFATDDFYPEGDGRVFGDITAEADYTPLGSNAEDFEANEEEGYYPVGEGRLIGDITSTTQYTPFGYNADEFATDGAELVEGATDMVDFTESSADRVLPEGDGRVIGQSVADTDFTPLGARAEANPSNYAMGVGAAFLVGLLANLARNMNKGKDEPPENGE